jgi:hypothetical protein
VASRYFRATGIPVIFTAVSLSGDYGYVLVQDKAGPCIACMFPDMINDDRYPCPGTPAIAEILQAVGSLTVYAVDTLLMNRRRTWNYRRVSLCLLQRDAERRSAIGGVAGPGVVSETDDLSTA